MKFYSLPHEVEAVKWNGGERFLSGMVINWSEDRSWYINEYRDEEEGIRIRPLYDGDWIALSIDGEPCEPFVIDPQWIGEDELKNG